MWTTLPPLHIRNLPPGAGHHHPPAPAIITGAGAGQGAGAGGCCDTPCDTLGTFRELALSIRGLRMENSWNRY